MTWWPFGGSGDSPATPATPNSDHAATEPSSASSSSLASSNKQTPPASCPVSSSQSRGKCPVDHSKFMGDATAATDRLRRDNLIPVGLSATADDQQPRPLDTTRQVSTIPRAAAPLDTTDAHQHQAQPQPDVVGNDTAGTGDDKWVYPSPQQFYNALKRKGFETEVDDVPMIVHIHNQMNERCWAEIKRWERLATGDASAVPKLKRFQGRPNDLTPKAYFFSRVLRTAPEPFDRHDWTVDRDGKEVRYVIDYYSAPPSALAASDAGANEAVMHVDARPAVDDLASAVHRMRGLWADYCGGQPAADSTETH